MLTRRFRGIFIGLVVLMLAGPAWAQYRLGDGRLLDRNLERGSGGVNPGRRPNTMGEYSDAIITGNVTGLARFRGDIDYLAPGEFTDTTAADDLYQFERQSRPTAPVTQFQRRSLGISDTAAAGRVPNPLVNAYRANAPVLIRPGSGVTTGEITGHYRRLPSPAQFETTAATVRQGQGIVANQLAAGDRLTDDTRDLGIAATQTGELLRVTTSPLLGLRREVIGTLESQGGELVPPSTLTPEQADEQREQEAEQASPQNLSYRAQVRDAMIAPSLLIGAQLSDDARISSQVEGTPFRTEALEARIFEPDGIETTQPGQDVYFDLIRNIRRHADRGAEQVPGDQLATPRPEQAPVPGEQQDRLGGEPDEARPQTATDRIREQFEAARRGDPEVQKKAAEALAKKLSYDLPPLTTFTAPGGTAFNQAMQTAERAMEQGRYFEADNYYSRALALRPGYPLAQVGRINAQLGAGMFISAGVGLRTLFVRHPEVIAARYDQPLLPSEQRLASITATVERMATVDRRPEATVALAYLAWQQGHHDQVRDALTMMIERGPHDPLPRLLWQVWLPDEPQPVDQQPEPAAESETEPDSDAPAEPQQRQTPQMRPDTERRNQPESSPAPGIRRPRVP